MFAIERQKLIMMQFVNHTNLSNLRGLIKKNGAVGESP